MSKQDQLDAIAGTISRCRICKKEKSGKPVPGEGNPDADIMFIGEAPGRQEAASGRPFIGRSGKLLRSLISQAGLSEREVYITSPVKYLPDRGTPTPADIAHGMIHLRKQIAVIGPKILVLLGNTACRGVLGEKIPVLTKHGSTVTRDGRTYFITLHPAAAIRFKKFKSLLLEDFKKLHHLVHA